MHNEWWTTLLKSLKFQESLHSRTMMASIACKLNLYSYTVTTRRSFLQLAIILCWSRRCGTGSTAPSMLFRKNTGYYNIAMDTRYQTSLYDYWSR